MVPAISDWAHIFKNLSGQKIVQFSTSTPPLSGRIPEMPKNCVLGHPFLGPLRRFYIKNPQDHPVPTTFLSTFFQEKLFFLRARAFFFSGSASGKRKKSRATLSACTTPKPLPNLQKSSHTTPIPAHTTPIPSHTVPYPPKPSHTVPYPPILSHTVPYCPIPCHTVPYCPIPSHTLPYPNVRDVN